MLAAAAELRPEDPISGAAPPSLQASRFPQWSRGSCCNTFSPKDASKSFRILDTHNGNSTSMKEIPRPLDHPACRTVQVWIKEVVHFEMIRRLLFSCPTAARWTPWLRGTPRTRATTAATRLPADSTSPRTCSTSARCSSTPPCCRGPSRKAISG